MDEQLRHVVIAHEPQWSEKDIEIDLDLPATKIIAVESTSGEGTSVLVTLPSAPPSK